jgi:hypothetical protein
VRRGLLIVPALVAVAALAGAPAAGATTVPDCANLQAPRILLTGQGQLESVLVDQRGRLIYTDRDRQALMVIGRKGAPPRVLADGIADPGGLAEDRRGRILVGFGNNVANSLAAPAIGNAGLYAVDPRTGAKSLVVSGLSMANGIARADDGTLYASSDFSATIDRVLPGQPPQRAWATPRSSNGLALSGRYLFANVSLPPTEIIRIDVRNPALTGTWAAPPPEDATAFLDGLTIGRRARLVAAAWVAGEIWRVDGPGQLCALARGLNGASAVALGHGDRGFRAGRVYAVNYGGSIVELPRAGVCSREAKRRSCRKKG